MSDTELKKTINGFSKEISYLKSLMKVDNIFFITQGHVHNLIFHNLEKIF